MSEVAQNQRGARARRAAILGLVRECGSVAVTELAPRFSVSAETIRRDLRALEAERALERHYGVIRVVESGLIETALDFRATHHTAEKSRIAAEAVRRLGDAGTVFIDEGFLPSLVAEALPTDRPLTVLTASIPVVLHLVGRPQTEVIMIGGRVRAGTLGVVDALAIRGLEGFAPDLAILGANGVSADGALTTPDPAVAAVKQTALRVSARALFVGGHDKFGRSSFVRFGTVDEVEALITGTELPATLARDFAALGTRVVRV